MDAIANYQPTSKCSLKMFCIMVAKGDVRQADELYDFMVKDMEDLPMFDPKQPTWVDNTKNAVTGFLGFVKENKDGIGQVYDVIRGVLAARGKNLPPIGGNVAEEVVESLPNIN